MPFSLDDVPDQAGRVIVITGASSGIGLAAARILVERNAHVVMACRNVAKAQRLADGMNRAISAARGSGGGRATVLRMDTTELDSIDLFVQSLQDADVTQVHGLILNAGIVASGYETIPTRSEEHPVVESTMACNVVGHFYAAVKLMRFIEKTPRARVVTVSSMAAAQTNKKKSVDYDVFLNRTPEKFDSLRMYAASKLADLWLADELQRRFARKNINATAVAAHPGYSRTHLQDDIQHCWTAFLMWATRSLSMDAEGGGLVLAIAATLNTAQFPDHPYFAPNGFLGFNGPPIANARMPSQGRDEEQAKKLWQCCENLCAYTSPI